MAHPIRTAPNNENPHRMTVRVGFKGVLTSGFEPLASSSGLAAFMMIVGLLAALGPARAGLGVQPTEALRQE